MAIIAIELAIICDDIEEDGLAVLSVVTEALGLDPEKDNILLEKGTDESGYPVLLATLSVADDDEEAEKVPDDSSNSREAVGGLQLGDLDVPAVPAQVVAPLLHAPVSEEVDSGRTSTPGVADPQGVGDVLHRAGGAA